ncbi:transcription antitermination factor NusB [Allochromatium vinosum]|uniref:Transcription antitermination protein NusB n=1 Tax=Allochromatium vinosum (strain ATCC 17899 / DSM 180 / NBRC 103801 / NCIMB 10441 / D) TaxID=572477 RepID=D3RU37_ALLVD|nr:transcription antitermination factor NusB [Allochromatium vinosum]ADC62696.1 NusB antitermination factor [Allochromatium vinosum DSM 180]MBK1656102.1 transcription antitermination factor NusB [Allochromatium vinosum]
MTTPENPRPISPRSQSRRYAALALYQWRLTGDDPMAIKRHLLDDPKWLDAVAASLNGVSDEDELAAEDRFNFNVELLDELLNGVPTHIDAIDAQLDRFLDRPISQVDPVELAILRLGAYEILFSDNIPDRVAINEAVELTKLLGAHEGHKYVNGVLDKIARRKAGDMDRKL